MKPPSNMARCGDVRTSATSNHLESRPEAGSALLVSPQDEKGPSAEQSSPTGSLSAGLEWRKSTREQGVARYGGVDWVGPRRAPDGPGFFHGCCFFVLLVGAVGLNLDVFLLNLTLVFIFKELNP